MADLNDLSKWSGNFTNREHVQPQDASGENTGNFLSGESAVVVAGPPSLSSLDTGDKYNESVIPIGLVQQAQLSQNKQINQIFEIGGRVPFFIPGRVSVNASLSKILFDGPSLAYALYRSGNGDGDGAQIPGLRSNDVKDYDKPSLPYPDAETTDFVSVAPDSNSPGLFWINLASRIFNKPLGLGFMLFDMEGQAYGGAYLEGCYLNSHRFGISANATVLAENVSLVAKKIKPISAASMGIVSDYYTR